MNETKPPLTHDDIYGPGILMGREGEIINDLREKLATMTAMYDRMKDAKFEEAKRANAIPVALPGYRYELVKIATPDEPSPQSA